MKPLLPYAAAGATCLPVTYNLTRGGDVFFAPFAVAAIGIAVALLCGARSAKGSGWLSLRRAALAFSIGAFISELAFFIHYYITVGYDDPKLSVGIGLSIVEFFTIALVGSFAICIVNFVRHHLASTKG